MVPATMIIAEVKTRRRRRGVKIAASRARGGFFITSSSTGSTPNDWAGGPSIKMSIRSQCKIGEVRLVIWIYKTAFEE
jgi:hypothetical protein